MVREYVLEFYACLVRRAGGMHRMAFEDRFFGVGTSCDCLQRDFYTELSVRCVCMLQEVQLWGEPLFKWWQMYADVCKRLLECLEGVCH